MKKKRRPTKLDWLKVVVLSLIGATLIGPCRADQNQQGIDVLSRSAVDSLFFMTNRLQHSAHLSLPEVQSITGIQLYKQGDRQYISHEPVEDKVLRRIEVTVDQRQVTDVLLYLPKQGLVITRQLVEERFGKWPTLIDHESIGKKQRAEWGCDKLLWLKYIRNDGGWNKFAFSTGKGKNLVAVEIVNAPEAAK